MEKAHRRVGQVAPEQFTERIAVGDAKKAEGAHHQVYVNRIDIRAEHTVPFAPIQYALQDRDDTTVQLMDDL